MSPKDHITANICRVNIRTYCYRIAGTIVKSFLPTRYTFKIISNKEGQDSIRDYCLKVPYGDEYEASVDIYGIPLNLDTTKNKLTNPRLEDIKQPIGSETCKYTLANVGAIVENK